MHDIFDLFLGKISAIHRSHQSQQDTIHYAFRIIGSSKRHLLDFEAIFSSAGSGSDRSTVYPLPSLYRSMPMRISTKSWLHYMFTWRELHLDATSSSSTTLTSIGAQPSSPRCQLYISTGVKRATQMELNALRSGRLRNNKEVNLSPLDPASSYLLPHHHLYSKGDI